MRQRFAILMTLYENMRYTSCANLSSWQIVCLPQSPKNDVDYMRNTISALVLSTTKTGLKPPTSVDEQARALFDESGSRETFTKTHWP